MKTYKHRPNPVRAVQIRKDNKVEWIKYAISNDDEKGITRFMDRNVPKAGHYGDYLVIFPAARTALGYFTAIYREQDFEEAFEEIIYKNK